MGPGGSCHEFILETSLQSRVQSSWKSHWAQRTDDNKSTPGTILANTFRENKLPTETNSSSAVTDARGEWNRIFKVLRGNKCQHGILHYHSSLREKHKQLEVHKNWELVHHPQTQNARDTTTKRSVRHKNVFARRGQNDEAFLSFTCSNLQMYLCLCEESPIFLSLGLEGGVVLPPCSEDVCFWKMLCLCIPPTCLYSLNFDYFNC